MKPCRCLAFNVYSQAFGIHYLGHSGPVSNVLFLKCAERQEKIIDLNDKGRNDFPHRTLGRERLNSELSHGQSQSLIWRELKAKQRCLFRGVSLGDTVDFVYVTVSQSCAGRDLVDTPKGVYGDT
jgi:hypothetical protein